MNFGLMFEMIAQSNFTSNVKPEIWDAVRSPFQAKHVNDNMFI